MSLVKKDDMTTLRAASAAKATAESAADDQQLMAVAFAINQASNTGEFRTIFQDKLRPAVKEELESKGYTIKYVHNNSYDMEHHALIVWGDVKPGDLIAEPSLNGPQHSNHPEEGNS